MNDAGGAEAAKTPGVVRYNPGNSCAICLAWEPGASGDRVALVGYMYRDLVGL